MRTIALIAVAALLCGCTPEAIQAPLMVDAFKAFRTKDRPGIDKAMDELAALEPKGEALGDPCSAESHTARRVQRHLFVLRALTGPGIMSMSEEARLLRLQNVLAKPDLQMGMKVSELRAMQKLMPPACPDNDVVRTAKMLDTAEAIAVLAGGVHVSQEWAKEVEARLGPQYGPRMNAAALTLARNGYSAEYAIDP